VHVTLISIIILYIILHKIGMATITPVLWTYRSNKDGEHAIRIRIEAGGQTGYHGTGIHVSETHWHIDRKTVRAKHPHSSDINSIIEQHVFAHRSAAYELEAEGVFVTPALIKERVAQGRPTRDADFIQLCRSRIAQLTDMNKVHSAKRYDSILRKFIRFIGKSTLPISELSPALLRRFEAHLVKELGNKNSTVSSNLRALKAMYSIAERDGHTKDHLNPFAHIKISDKVAEKRFLTPDELRAMLSAGGQTEFQDLAIAAFAFSFYCGGVRFGDLCRLTSDNIISDPDLGMMLSFKVSKTGANKRVPIPDPARTRLPRVDGHIRDGFLFPFLDGYDLSTSVLEMKAIGSRNSSVNRALKVVAEQKGVHATVTFHMARHSFADLARRRNIPVYNISKMLGHSNVNVTERYLQPWDIEAVREIANMFPGRRIRNVAPAPGRGKRGEPSTP